MAGKEDEKQHKRLWRKSRTGSGEKTSETELRGRSKSFSATREKHRRTKSLKADIALKVPDFEDYMDLMNNDTAGGPELEELEGPGYPKRTKSYTQSQTKLARTFAQAAAANPQALSPVAGPTPVSSEKSLTRSKSRTSDAGVAQASEGGGRPLPRLLAPRTSVAELMAAANRAVSSPVQQGQTVESEELAEVSAVSISSETSPLKLNSAEPKRKKSHSAMGHLWKTIKNDLLNPKAAAADFQKLSVSAVRQATVVMSSVAENAEAEMTNLHDQLLGGKRNLPDHPAKPLSSARSLGAKVANHPASPQPAVIVAVRADSGIESKATPAARISPTPRTIVAQHFAAASELLKAAQPGAGSSNPAWPATKAPLLSKPQSQKPLGSRAGPGISSNEAAAASASKTEPDVVERSRGSAYMLSKYEDEPESPHRLAETLSKTAEVIAQGTAQMLTGANHNAVYLKRLLMCGLGGRTK